MTAHIRIPFPISLRGSVSVMADESTEVNDLTKQLADLRRELSATKGDLVKATNSAKSSEEANAKLTTELAEARDHVKEANAEARERRLELRKVETERDEIFTLYNDLEAKNTTLTEQLQTDPEGLRAKVGEYQQKLRNVAHDRAFEKVAKSLNVTDPTKYADLITLAKYEPETDDPDETKIAEKFGEVIKGRDWLKDAAPAAAAETPATPPTETNGSQQPVRTSNGFTPHVPGSLTPAPGHDRGTSLQTEQVERPSSRIAGKF